MRGSTRIGLMAVSLLCMFAFIAATAFADEDDRLLDQKTAGVLMHDVAGPNANQPDTLEFISDGAVTLKTTLPTVTCEEIEVGTTVVQAKATMAKPTVALAIPWGVAENGSDTLTTPKDCTAPTWFDTTAEGAVGGGGKVATVTVGDTNNLMFVAEFHNLKFSVELGAGLVCTGNLDTVKVPVENITAGFMEEKTPNLNVKFVSTVVPVIGTGCPTTSELSGKFFLETGSGKFDTAFLES
jgi:hypothetical protein